MVDGDNKDTLQDLSDKQRKVAEEAQPEPVNEPQPVITTTSAANTATAAKMPAAKKEPAPK
jgi:hypothetical protein